jgi:hypothetical protein
MSILNGNESAPYTTAKMIDDSYYMVVTLEYTNFHIAKIRTLGVPLWFFAQSDSTPLVVDQPFFFGVQRVAY